MNLLKKAFTKISLIFLILIIFSGCNTLRKVPKGKHLLAKNEFIVNDKSSSDEEVQNLTYQKPNTKVLWYRFRLFMYNLALQNPDSVYKSKFVKNPSKYFQKSKWLSKKQVDRLGKSFYYNGIHEFLKKNGEAQSLFDENRSKKTLLRIDSYFQRKGFFDVKSNFKIDTLSQNKIKVNYVIKLGNPFVIDTIKIKIKTPQLDSIYNKNIANTFLKKEQYNIGNLDKERSRITNIYRNNGVYHFQQNFINFSVDTINTKKKVNLNLIINDRDVKTEDSTKTEPFKIYKISAVNVFTDANASKKNDIKKDSIVFKNCTIFSSGKLKFKPKAITDAIFLNKGNLFADNKTILTNEYLSNLRVFNYPTIQYVVDKKDTINNGLIANIYLSQRDKYNFRLSFDLTRSNIQQFGITGNGGVSIRNIFRGAETLEISARINLGSSKGLANPNNLFFNILEYGLDSKIIFPRILFPIDTDRIIPKTMIPSTILSAGLSKQTNIGLDKQNFSAVMAYSWTPKKNSTTRFELFNIQFVKNVNVSNYFNVYKSSYNVLNSLAQIYNTDKSLFDENNNLIINDGTSNFINSVLGNSPRFFPNTNDFKTISSVEERRKRLSQNELIFASSINFIKTNKKNNDDNNYFSIRTKIESAGNLLSLISKNPLDADGNQLLNNFFGVNYSQYLKAEYEFIKHWKLRGKQVLAFRSFTGFALPYGNSKSVPFSRSYFGGGPNDNRAWQVYSLGPGSSGGLNDFNDANFKISLNTELRFNIFNKINGAIFIDAGNIWNVKNNVAEEASNFVGIKSLENTSVGSGFGLRYDFNFFIARLDIGFKTYDPSITDNKKWFRNYNFANSTLNIAINYPF
jgi:outer membrane protein assembly factor BamA